MTPGNIQPMEVEAKSPKNSLNKEDIKNILRQILIFLAPVGIMLLDQLEAGEINFTLLYGFTISIVIESARRFLREVR